MRPLAALLLSIFFFQAQAQKPKVKTYLFAGIITQTSEYCGGPAPTEEMQAAATTPRPYAGKVLFIKRGTQNHANVKKICVLLADSNGKFSVRLPAGKYCIVQESQLKPLDVKAYSRQKWLKVSSTACLKKWWSDCFYTFEIVKTDVTGFKIHYHQRCFLEHNNNPCITYTGPLPD